MKATGIIRRIDDLGRIVIPKEIRKKLKIQEGNTLEIFIDNEDRIILQKYSNIKNIKDIAELITDSIHSVVKDTVLITDTENVIAASGINKKILMNKEISSELREVLYKRKNTLESNIKLVDNVRIEGNYKINIILENGDVSGSIILIANEIDKNKEEILNINTIFLNKYLEE